MKETIYTHQSWKKSASWQLVAAVLELKTMPRGKKRRKLAKNDAKRQNKKWPKPTKNKKKNSPKQKL